MLNRRVQRWAKDVTTEPAKLVVELEQRLAVGSQMRRDAPLSAALVLPFYVVLREVVLCALAVAGVRELLARPGQTPSHAELIAVVLELAAVRPPIGSAVSETITHTAAKWCRRRGSFAAYAELYVAAHVIAAAGDGPEWTITLPLDLDARYEEMTDAAADLAEEIEQLHGTAERRGFVVLIRRSNEEAGPPPALIEAGGGAS